MEKRNTLLLTVIAVATLLVAVIGATFAYFASNTNIENVANLTATTASSSSSFIATGAEIVMNVTAANMVEARGTAQGNLAATSETTTENFKVNFTAGTTESLSCTYHVYYEYYTNSDDYAKTEGLQTTDKEFSYEVTYTTNDANSTTLASETQFIDFDSTNPAARQDLGSVTITNNSESTATVQDFTIVTRFYNFNRSQSGNAGKTWKIKFYVDSVVC